METDSPQMEESDEGLPAAVELRRRETAEGSKTAEDTAAVVNIPRATSLGFDLPRTQSPSRHTERFFA